MLGVQFWILTSVWELACGLRLFAADATWSEDHRLLYAGIPVQVRFSPADTALEGDIWRYLEGIDAAFNDYRDDSEIGIVNRAGVGDHRVSTELADAFSAGRAIGILTEGAFDLTVGPLRRVWREAERSGQPATPAALTTAMQQVGPSTWSLEGSTLHVSKPGVKFDFGGLIKGMAVDHALTMAITGGATAALIQVGGETTCFGLSQHGEPHRLGIPDPDHPDNVLVRLQDPGTGLSGSTSANYFNAIVIGGRPYYHIFDPRTGAPVETHVLSASVVFPRCGRNGLADGLCKGGVINGWDWLAKTVTRLGAEATIILRTADGGKELKRTPGWSRLEIATESGTR